MNTLSNPALLGAFKYDSVVYGAGDVNYASGPELNQFAIYDAPDPIFLTPRFNLSAFAELGTGTPWPFAVNVSPRSNSPRCHR